MSYLNMGEVSPRFPTSGAQSAYTARMTRKRPSPTSKAIASPEYQRLRKQILKDPDATCGFCGGTGADSVDHIIPTALGGTNAAENLRPAHKSCNAAAGARLTNKLRAGKRVAVKRPVRVKNDPAPTPKGSKKAPVIDGNGLVLPRFETPAGGGVVGSLGSEAVKFVNDSGVLGVNNSLRPWQEHVLGRALEITETGELRWPTVIVTVARQQGKSWLLRGLGWWRCHSAARFGEPQTVLHVANKSQVAAEAWRPAAALAAELYGTGQGIADDGRARMSAARGSESLQIPDRSRWLVQAATPNAGIGFSISLAIVDEAWAIKRDIVESAISPTMSAREQPQLWLVSTAGDSGSDLLRAYRESALLDRAGTGEVLLLEWSAPPELSWDSPEAWRWANPDWDDRREKFLRSRAQVMPEALFRQEFANSWVSSSAGWLPPSAWDKCARGRLSKPRAKDAPVVAIDVEPDGSRVAVVTVWPALGRAAVTAEAYDSLEVAWRRVKALKPHRLLLPPTLAVHYAGDPRVVVSVSGKDLRTYLPAVTRAVHQKQIVYAADDRYLTDHILRAVSVTNHNDGGLTLSSARSNGPITAARAFVWAVGEFLRPRPAKPQILAG